MKFLNWSNVPMTTKKFKVKIIRIYEFYMLAGRMNIISINFVQNKHTATKYIENIDFKPSLDHIMM